MLSAFSQAWASWKTSPGVALLAVVAFAVGIGSATSIFTVINGVLLRPLPYPSGERFVSLYGASTTGPGTMMAMSVPELQDYEQQTTSFDAFGWFRAGRYPLTAPGEPQFVAGAAVTPALARQLGPPLLGQWFADDTSAVISTALWRRLGGGREIIGSVITLDERQYTISGVMPPTFQFPLASLEVTRGDTEVWIPLRSVSARREPGQPAVLPYARRKPGVSLEQASADVKRVAVDVAANDPARYRNYTAGVADLREATIGMFGASVRAPLLILLGGAGLLLLIACANVATLLLARSVVRARETAIRVALGASRRQLALRYFAEGALVSVAGAAAGVGLSVILVRYILAAASAFIPRVDDITIDWTVLGFSVAVAVATGVLAGLAPLWQAIRMAPNAVLSEGVRASAAAPARRLSKAFVVAEIALAFTLLTTSAILVVHLRNLERVSLGFDPDGLFVFDLTLPRRTEASAEARALARRAEQARLMDALRQTPGVTGAAFANQLPAGPFCGDTPIYVEGRPRDALEQRVCILVATPDFFSTMRIPLRAGRLLNESDSQPREATTVVINEAAARAYWPERNPIGASVRLSTPANDPLEVVGVVGDVRNSGLSKPAAPEIYVPAAVLGANPMKVLVRSGLPADQLIPTLRRAIRQADPTLVMENVSTINDIMLYTLQLERLSSLRDDILRPGGAADGDARHLRRGVVLRPAAHHGAGHADGPRRRQPRSRGARPRRRPEAVAGGRGGGIDRARRRRLAARAVPRGRQLRMAAVCGVHGRGRPRRHGGRVGAGVAHDAPVADGRHSRAAAIGLAVGASADAARRSRHSPGGRRGRQRIGRLAGRRADGLRRRRAQRQLVQRRSARRARQRVRGAARRVGRAARAARRLDAGVPLPRRRRRARNGRTGRGRRRIPDHAAARLSAAAAVCAERTGRPRRMGRGAPSGAARRDSRARRRRHPPGRAAAHTQRDPRRAAARRTVLRLASLAQGKPQRAGFSAHEKQVLRACADQFALMIENARLTDRVVEQETLRRDIALASDVQRRLLPDAPPQRRVCRFRRGQRSGPPHRRRLLRFRRAG